MELDRITPPKTRPITELKIPYPEEHILKNGIPLRIMKTGTEEVVRLDIIVNGGRLATRQPFLALLTNRMLREGSQHYTSSVIAEKLDYYGASLELSVSLKKEFVTLYSINKYFSRTLAIVADMVKYPTFPEQELKTVLEMNKQQFRVLENKVDTVSQKVMNLALFGAKHPIGYYSKVDDFDKLNVNLIKEYYRDHYYSNNTIIFLSGNVTQEIIQDIENQLGNEPWGIDRPKFEAKPFRILTSKEKLFFIEKPDAIQNSLKMGYLTIGRNHPDYAKLRVLVVLLGGYFGSRLMKNIRERKGYTYGIGSTLMSITKKSVFLISTEADNQYIPAIIKETKKQIDRLCTVKVGPAELNMVKNYMLGDFCRSFEGPFSLSDAWIYIETNGLDMNFYQRLVEEIRTVSRDDILRLAQIYLCKENLIEVVTGEKM
ncbi:MAG: M16 family metallopeptidase [Phocaeicola sp.]|uniref:M16 family metallopeptidase n=1 Tax=Phocaeicola sp. TaxID=2773926 RepID=UPI003FA046A8